MALLSLSLSLCLSLSLSLSLHSGSCCRPRSGILTHVRVADGRRRRLLWLEPLRAAGDGRHEQQRYADGGDGAGSRWARRASWIRVCVRACVRALAQALLCVFSYQIYLFISLIVRIKILKFSYLNPWNIDLRNEIFRDLSHIIIQQYNFIAALI